MNLSSIHPKAKIGKNVTISNFVTIEEDVIVGDNTWIGPNVCLMNGARIGKDCKIFPGAVIAAIPQDLKFIGEYSTAEIGDGTTIRECVTVNRGTQDRHKTVIGKNCLLMAYSHVGHDSFLGDHVILGNCTAIAGHCDIEDWAIIEAYTGVTQFLHVGAHAFIGAGIIVIVNVPPYIKAAKSQLVYAGVNSVGLKRRGFSDQQINQIAEIYRVLYLKNLNTSNALQKIEEDIEPSQEREKVLDFFKNSSNKKGFVKAMK